MRRTPMIVLALIVSYGGIGARPSTKWIIRDLGALPGGIFSQAYAINDRGQVVGRSGTLSGATHAILWDGAVAIDLGVLPGADHSEAYDINHKGQIVGISQTTGSGCPPLDTCTRAFLLEEGIMTPLRPLAGRSSLAYGINNRGQVVGLSTTTAWGDYHAVMWTPDGQIIDLGMLPGDTFGHANAIDDHGRVVGWSSGETTRAFLWENGVMFELGTLNGSYSQAVDINKHGLIFGIGDDNGTRPPVVWSRDGVTALPLPPDAYADVLRANDRGVAVGRSWYYPDEIVAPVMWIDGRVIELPSLPARSNYTSYSGAYDVNNRRQVAGESNGRAVVWEQP